jgi:hypothetical protein
MGVCEQQKLCLCPEELPACSKFEQKQQTVFKTITASPEVLAEKLVFWMSWHKANGSVEWVAVSTIVKGEWETREEAIAATVARLKEVEK